MKNRNFISLFFTISLALASNSLFALQITSMKAKSSKELIIETSDNKVGIVSFDDQGIPVEYKKIDTGVVAEQEKYQSNHCTINKIQVNFSYLTYVNLNGKDFNKEPYPSNITFTQAAVDISKEHVALLYDYDEGLLYNNKKDIAFFYKETTDPKGFIYNIPQKVSALAYLNNETLVSSSNNEITVYRLKIQANKITEIGLRKSYSIDEINKKDVKKEEKEISEEKSEHELEKKEQPQSDNTSWLSKIKLPSFITTKTIFCGVIVAAILFAYYKGHLA